MHTTAIVYSIVLCAVAFAGRPYYVATLRKMQPMSNFYFIIRIPLDY